MGPSESTPQDLPRPALGEVAAVLRGAARVLAICHVNPDADAIGSLLGLAWVLRGLPQPPAVCLVCADPVPGQLQFLPGAGEIRRSAAAGPWDAVVCLDASDPARLGPPYAPDADGQAPIIVLDHHVTNLHFGTLNYVDTRAAATAQIVAELADALAAPISRDAAICLLAGLTTDTLSFRTSNITPGLFALTARLMAAGADLAAITQRTLYDRPTAILRLWGAGLSAMQLDGHVAWTAISLETRRKLGLAGTTENGLTSQLINASEARVAAVFNEIEPRRDAGRPRPRRAVEVSLRSRPGYDVSEVALRLGGGGHPQAAGFTLPGSLAEVEARVLPLLAEVAEP